MKAGSGLWCARIVAGLLAWASCDVAQARIFWVGAPPCQYEKLQDAVAAARSHVGDPGGDVIRVTSETWTSQAIVIIEQESLTIEGGWPRGCDPNSTREPFHSVFGGAGGVQAPVFNISAAQGASINLDWLRIERGDAFAGRGGGIYFEGDGILRLTNTRVSNNQARSGGGIYAKGTGSHAELILGPGTVVERNRAIDSGGGVYAESLEMTMEGNSIISTNIAAGEGASTGYGGGLRVLGNDFPGIAYIRSTGDPTRGTIYDNDALYGGGIAVEHRRAGGSRQAFVELYTTDPSRPVVIRDNRASVEGGGLHLENSCDECRARIHAWDISILANRAPAGAAVYSGGRGGSFWLNDENAAYLNSRPRPPGSVPCHAAARCSRIEDNLSVNANGTPALGATLQIPKGSAYMLAFHARNNRGGRWLDTVLARVRSALITDNQTTLELLRTTGFSVIRDVTIADNAIGSARVISFDDDSSVAGDLTIEVSRSIIWQPGKTTVARRPSRPFIGEYVLSDELGSLGNAISLTSEPPRFIDADNGNYHLQPGSNALDFSPAFNSVDLEGRPRSKDLPRVFNKFGPTDLGPFERQTMEPLLHNPTFDAGLGAWKEVTPGSTAWDPATAAVRLDFPWLTLPGESVFGRRQCVYLPDAGLYRLSGRGRTEAEAVQTQGDDVLLYWEFRKNGGKEACIEGPPTASGTVLLGNGTQWTVPHGPAYISVPLSQFTTDSSIFVAMLVIDRGSGRTIGWFDDIELGFGEDSLFANGFD